MAQPKVSIVVPCWGVEKYLDQCVKSLINQTLREIEIILVDDVSPDRVPEMCDAWAQKDSRIKVVHKQKNEGLGLACNTGIDSASGEFIAFCDSDDWVDEEMYETMYKAAIDHQAQVVYTGLKRVDMYGNLCGNLPHKAEKQVYQGKFEVDCLACDMVCSTPEERWERTIQASAKVVLYNLEMLKKNKIYFVSERVIPSEDLHFNLSVLSKAVCVCVLPVRFYNYRWNSSSISGTVSLDLFERNKKLYNYTKNECKSLGFTNDIDIRLMRLLIGSARTFICHLLNSNFDEKIKRDTVTALSKDDIWDEVWKQFPVRKYTLYHRLFFVAMRYNMYTILRLMAKRSRS